MVPVVSDCTWYFPRLLHLERLGGWIAFLQPLNKVMEGAGALRDVDCAGDFCLELGKEGKGGAEFYSASPTGMEARGCHGTDPWSPQYLPGSPQGHPACPRHNQTGKGTTGRNIPSLCLAAFSAELLEISRVLHRFGLLDCMFLAAGGCCDGAQEKPTLQSSLGLL